MSTEQKPATPATETKHEPNALATGLTSGWERFKQGKLISYPLMALILFLVAGVGVGIWVWRERARAESARWTDWDKRSSVASLEEFAKANPGTIQAKLANLDVARRHLGPEGIDRMHVEAQIPGDPESERRAKETRDAALRNIELSREEFEKALGDFAHDPVISVECMWSRAKAEAVLVGIPREGQVEQRRGDPAKAVEWLKKTAEAAPDTPVGKDAKKLADALSNQNTAQQVATLQASVLRASPTLPGFEPKAPGAPPK
jgi:hypothetical protein